MESLYRKPDADAAVEKYGKKHGEDLALRVYTSRLLGQDPSLVLHGGGNTSVKSRVTELLGDVTDVVFVKGSGWDLGAIEPEGFPACRLAHLRRCCERAAMTDEEMVAQLRGQMIDPASPTPSVEALLHAYLPAKFIDHTHADAVLAVVDQPRSEELVREVFGDRALFVPYVMPGFALARRVAELWNARAGAAEPSVMILDKHGIFTWGETAIESYERMIANVSLAERWLSDQRPPKSRRTISSPSPELGALVAPIARGVLERASNRSWIACFRATPSILAFSDREDLVEVATEGCATPDHVIRTKAKPLLVPLVDYTDAGAVRTAIGSALAKYEVEYHDYFRRGCAARRVTLKELDPWPRVLLFPGLGALTVGRTRAEADIVGDIYEHTVEVADAAATISAYQPVGELDLFDVEYWSLEQAKLGKPAPEAPLDRRIVFITGGASGIGLATARAMLAAGAHVMLTDRDGARLETELGVLRTRYQKRIAGMRCDVGIDADVRRALAATCHNFGGVDVVVSNAGVAWTGALHTREGEAALLQSIEVNLFAHQTVARAACDVMLAQGQGGVLLFNGSKSAFNQGEDFGPYAIPKAALLALMRQYAVDLGPRGVRSNAVNADRVRTQLFGAGMLESRAKARGLDVDHYFSANLLKRETLAEDVAQAFVYLATAEGTTGCVITVDGGNAAAFPR